MYRGKILTDTFLIEKSRVRCVHSAQLETIAHETLQREAPTLDLKFRGPIGEVLLVLEHISKQ